MAIFQVNFNYIIQFEYYIILLTFENCLFIKTRGVPTSGQEIKYEAGYRCTPDIYSLSKLIFIKEIIN